MLCRSRRRSLLGALLVVTSLVTVVAASAQPSMRRELRVGVAGMPAVLDPEAALEGAGPLIARQVFDGLVAYREGSTDIEPALATRWAVSRDGLIWSFTLRDNVRFHDGTPLTPHEVAASFERTLRGDPAKAVAWAGLLRGIPGVVREVRAADAHTVQFILAQPYAPLLTVLAHPGLAVSRVTTDGSGRLVGTGPYRIVDTTPGRIALELVSGHWSGVTRPERMVFLEVVSDESAEAEMDARALDVWFPSGPPRRADGALSIPGTQVGYLAFQTERGPFSNKRLRQAVAAALDPAVIAAALDRVAVPLASFLPVGVWARRESSPVIGGTHQMVKAFLAESGWPKGARATLLASSDTQPVDVPRLADALRTMLGADDIPVQLRLEAADGLVRALGAGDYDMLLLEASVTGGDPHLLLFPLSTSEGARPGPLARNYSYYRNPRLDDTLARASQLSMRVERARLYKRAQALLADELPWIPIYVRLVWGVARPEVRNLRLHPTGFHRLSGVSLEPVPLP